MNCVAIIQARTGSTRLPNKIMKKINGKYILDLFLERLKKSKLLNNIIIATTINKNDDVLEKFCIDRNIDYYRGSENNLLDRFYNTAIIYKVDIIVRITSDCPLIDPNIVDDMINIFIKNKLKYMTMKYSNDNIGAKGGFPDGCNPQIINFEMLKEAYQNAKTKYEIEHVVPYIEKKYNKYLYEIKLNKPYKNINFKKLHLSLDTQKDYILLKNIFENLYKKNINFTIYDVLDFINQHSHLLI